MKTSTKGLNKLAKKITAHLKALHPEKRPTMRNGFSARCVNYTANGFMAVLTDHGHETFVSVEEAKTWLTL